MTAGFERATDLGDRESGHCNGLNSDECRNYERPGKGRDPMQGFHTPSGISGPKLAGIQS
jgi:hypothetical protein